MSGAIQTTNKTWGWGIIGTGNIANKFASDLQFAHDAKKTAIYSRTQKNAQSFADIYGFQKSYSDLDAFLADAEVEIVYIATPHIAHVEQALACIAAGKAVLIEKPIAMTSSDVAIIQAAAEEKGVFVMEGMWSRFLPAVQRAKATIDSGKLGKPLRAEATIEYERAFDPEDRLFNPALGGGVLHDLGVYPISLSAYLLGDLTLKQSNWIAAPNGINTRAEFTLSANDVPIDVKTTFDCNGDNCLTIYLEKGVLRIDRDFLRANQLTIWNKPRHSVPVSYPGIYARIRNKLQLHGGKTEKFERLGVGLHYQVSAVQAALNQKLTSHPIMPLKQSAMALDIIAAILEKPASG